MFKHVIEKLQISKEKMQREYNKTIRVIDYEKGSKVWLKVKHYKTGEYRKLSPRRNGPWTVTQKLPNGVNFEIINDSSKEKKVVHHDRLSPVKECLLDKEVTPREPRTSRENERWDQYDEISTSESGTNSDVSDYDVQSNDSASDIEERIVIQPRIYPERVRTQQQIPGAIPWDAIQI